MSAVRSKVSATLRYLNNIKMAKYKSHKPISLQLYTYRKNAHGESPIFLHIQRNGRKMITTKQSVKADDWDDVLGEVKPTHRNHKWLNNYLGKMLHEARDEALKEPNLTAKKIKKKIGGTAMKDYFVFAKEYIEQFNNERSFGTFLQHESALRVLEEYAGQKLNLSDVDVEFIERYKVHLMGSGNYGKRKLNTVGAHLKKMRTIMRAAVKRKYLSIADNPFNEVHIGSEDSHKEKLTAKELKKLINVKLVHWSGQWHARNCFLVQFYNRGSRISDVLTLEEKHLQGNRYSKMTRKKGVYVGGEQHPDVIRIFKTYISEKKKRGIESPYIIPIIREGDTRLVRRINNALTYMNRELKEVCKKIGINKNVSSHISRHTYGQRARDLGMDEYDIGQLLGQRSAAATRAYLRQLDSPELDVLNRKVTNL